MPISLEQRSVSLNHCSIPRCAEGRSEEPPMQTRALGSRVAWQNQVPVLDDSQTLVSRDGQGGSEIRGGMGHKLALNAKGGSQGTVQARPAVWVRVF
jgi:hypothetical protein